MTGPNDDRRPPTADDPSPADELREGLSHFFAAARKVVKNVEPHVNEGLEDAERLLGKLGRGGEAIANEVGKEVATMANRLAERLKAISDREDAERGEGTPPTGTPPTGTPPRDPEQR